MEMDIDEPEERTKCEVCVSGCKQVTTFTLSHIGLLTLVVCYCMAGAAIFESLESDHEILIKRNVTKIRKAVAFDLWNYTHNLDVINPENWSHYATQRLQNFENDLVKAMKIHGWDGKESETEVQWNKLGALFYSIIVITTIGYGHIAPKTVYGRIVTIFYAIIGIPLMVVCWSHIGDFMANSFRMVYWKVCCYICTRNPRPQRGSMRSSRTRSVRSRAPGSMRIKSRSIRRSGRTSQRSQDSAAISLDSVPSIASDPGVLHLERTYSHRLPQGPHRNYPHSSTLPRTAQPKSIPHPSRQISSGNRYNRSAEPEPAPITSSSALKELPVLFNRYAEDFPTRKPSDEAPLDEDELEENRDIVTLPRISSNKSRPRPPPLPRYLPAPEELEYWDDDEDDEYYEEEEEEMYERRPVPIWLCSFLVISYIVGGAYLFHEWEGWNMLDSAYFCFITLTTIGFGDYVPASRFENTAEAEVSIALCSLYLLFGIALLAMSFNLVQEQVINAFKDLAIQLGLINEDEV